MLISKTLEHFKNIILILNSSAIGTVNDMNDMNT